jgi:hypothetical protein
VFFIAYDSDHENPNPHPWELGGEGYETFEKAVEIAEEEVREFVDIEGYALDETRPWMIVRVEGLS